jgi:primosomal protein N'
MTYHNLQIRKPTCPFCNRRTKGNIICPTCARNGGMLL